MTQGSTNRFDREVNGKVPAFDVGLPGTEAGELSGLLDQTCRNTMRLLADFESPPRTLLVRAGTVSVEVNWDEQRITTESAAVTPQADEPVADSDPGVRYLTAPAVGVLYLAPEPDAKPFVSVGDTVLVGQQVAIIEAMKLMIPLEADQAGRVAEVFKENAEAVEYGERVFALVDADADADVEAGQA